MSGEASFIAALRSVATHPAARQLADDCAVLDFGSDTLVLTHDMMVEGVHWLPGQDPADIACKLVAVNLSDLAAKGAEPLGVLLGYSLGPDDLRFIEGLRQANGLIAGLTRMPWARFVLFNVLGAVLWVGAWAATGYLAGSHIQAIYDTVGRYSLYVVIALVGAAVGLFLLHRHRQRAAAA